MELRRRAAATGAIGELVVNCADFRGFTTLLPTYFFF